MSLLLQSNELSQDVFWLAGVAVLLVVAVLYYRKVKHDQAEREAINHDPRSHVVNDSNYNIDHAGIDDHRAEGMTADEAETVVKGIKESDTIPSREEFNELREDLRPPE